VYLAKSDLSLTTILTLIHQAQRMKMQDRGLLSCNNFNVHLNKIIINILFNSSPEESNSVVFEGGVPDDVSEDQTDSKEDAKRDAQEPREIQFLYIQMEFCEKSTLRFYLNVHKKICNIE